MEYDYLNSDGRRNIDNTSRFDYNCGGYALNTFNWYYPRDIFNSKNFKKPEDEWRCRDQTIGNILKNSNNNINTILNTYALRDSYYMIQNFNGKLRRINSLKDLKKNERIIAYRLGYDKNSLECDFHFIFKDYGDNKWSHKMGALKIENNKFTDDNIFSDIWNLSYYCYSSNIILMALKVKN